MLKVEYQIKVYIIYIPAKVAPNFMGGNGGGRKITTFLGNYFSNLQQF